MTMVCTFCARELHHAHACQLRKRVPPVEVGPEVVFAWTGRGGPGGYVRGLALTGLAPHLPGSAWAVHRTSLAFGAPDNDGDTWGAPDNDGDTWGVSCTITGTRITSGHESLAQAVQEAHSRLAQKTPEQYAAARDAELARQAAEARRKEIEEQAKKERTP